MFPATKRSEILRCKRNDTLAVTDEDGLVGGGCNHPPTSQRSVAGNVSAAAANQAPQPEDDDWEGVSEDPLRRRCRAEAEGATTRQLSARPGAAAMVTKKQGSYLAVAVA